MRVVNVCFHGVGTPSRGLETGEERYWVSELRFTEILDELVGRPDVRISFDDANASDMRIALPALQSRGLTATFFVVAGRLDTTGSLTSEEVRGLHAAGMEIGTHGMHHRPWRGLTTAEQREELITARHLIADVAGTEVLDAALPLGCYDRKLLSQLRSLGYRSVQTSDRRWARAGQWLQPRYSIRCEDSARSVEREVLRPPAGPTAAKGAVVGALKRLR